MNGSSDVLDGFGDGSIGALLAMAHRVSFNSYGALLDHLHLTPGQAEILNLLSLRQTVAIGTLAEMYRVKPPVMTLMIDGLVRMALVERHVDPHDRRRSMLLATEKGRQTMHELELIRDRMQHVLTANLTEQETVQLSTFLKKVIRSIESTNLIDVRRVEADGLQAD